MGGRGREINHLPRQAIVCSFLHLRSLNRCLLRSCRLFPLYLDGRVELPPHRPKACACGCYLRFSLLVSLSEPLDLCLRRLRWGCSCILGFGLGRRHQRGLRGGSPRRLCRACRCCQSRCAVSCVDEGSGERVFGHGLSFRGDGACDRLGSGRIGSSFGGLGSLVHRRRLCHRLR